MQYCLDTPITDLPRVGEEIEKKLARLSIATYRDALLHWPLRYENHSQLIPLAEAKSGIKGLFEGQVTGMRDRSRSLVLWLVAGGAMLRVVFFYKGTYRPTWQEGQRLRCFGEIHEDMEGPYLSHPQCQAVPNINPPPLPNSLSPVYPTTAGLAQSILRRIIGDVLNRVAGELNESDGLEDGAYWPLVKSLRFIHAPPPDVTLVEGIIPFEHPAWQRLITEELSAYYLAMQHVKEVRQQLRAPALGKPTNELLQHLPFKLTGAQARAAAAMGEDLQRSIPMQRLLQGDVGSGKTAVAAMAALQVVRSGAQVAIMAPTEMLALQHIATFTQWFEPLGIRVAGLVGKTRASARATIRTAVATGQVQILIGTHAIFQEDIAFEALALVIIDEQHRFGVSQRLALCSKGGGAVHQLVMSATPIPRTLAMAYYAELDISILDEHPPGRKPIKTTLVSARQRAKVLEQVTALCAEGGQVYWVCPLVEESEKIEAQDAESTVETLRAQLPHLRFGLVHGKMKSAEKQAMTEAFRAHELDVLVATTVIEVGIDVPNARLIVLENGERLGLSQAHQLRGRVGRGKDKSYCTVLYKTPLSPRAQARLEVLRDSQDGFVIAEQDLRLRGPGEILGLRQTGFKPFRVADWGRDRALLPEVMALCQQLSQEMPETVAHWMTRWYQDAPILHEV